MDILYTDNDIIVCIKPAGVLSTDEPGGLPELVRTELHTRDVRTVHRLDRVVSGLMVLARNVSAASELSRQIREGGFDKDYLAVVHGTAAANGEMIDLLTRNKEERKTYVTDTPGKGVQQAILRFETLAWSGGLSMVRIRLITGRTHQIRCQFSSRGLPLVGDRKYSLLEDDCPIALWSHMLSFRHPKDDEPMRFTAPPPAIYPWELFKNI